MRQEFTKATKLDAFTRSGGRCQCCTAKLFAGNIDYHHDTECTYGGGNDIGNCIVLCRACHSAITRKRAAVIAKSNRIRSKHIGIKRAGRTMAGRRFNGDPIPSRVRT